jgi:hypothetical protein
MNEIYKQQQKQKDDFEMKIRSSSLENKSWQKHQEAGGNLVISEIINLQKHHSDLRRSKMDFNHKLSAQISDYQQRLNNDSILSGEFSHETMPSKKRF